MHVAGRKIDSCELDTHHAILYHYGVLAIGLVGPRLDFSILFLGHNLWEKS